MANPGNGHSFSAWDCAVLHTMFNAQEDPLVIRDACASQRALLLELSFLGHQGNGSRKVFLASQGKESTRVSSLQGPCGRGGSESVGFCFEPGWFTRRNS